MIRRRNVQPLDQGRDKNDHSRESQQRRKESYKTGSRFNYQLVGHRADENADINDCAENKGKGHQECDDSFAKEVMNRTLVKSIKNCGLKKEHLYEDAENDRCEGKISLHRSRNQTMRYQKNNTSLYQQGDDIKNTSFQYFPQSLMPTTLAYKTGFIAEPSKNKNRSNRKRECLNSEEDLQMKYQQLWQNNQRKKQRYPRQQLLDNRLGQHVVINTKNSNSKNKRDERSFSLKQEQQVQSAVITHREYNRVSNVKAEHFNCMQTRKTSPIRFHNSTSKNISEEMTLRCSPVKHIANNPIPSLLKCTNRLSSNLHPQQIQANLRLIEEFSSRLSLKIQEVTVSLLPLRTQR